MTASSKRTSSMCGHSDRFSGHFTDYFGRLLPRNEKATFRVLYFIYVYIYIGLGCIYRIRIGLGPKSDDCFTLCSENERIARYTSGSSDQSSATDLRRPKNDDCYTLCSENERIARYTRNERPQTRSGSSTSERKCVSVV